MCVRERESARARSLWHVTRGVERKSYARRVYKQARIRARKRKSYARRVHKQRTRDCDSHWVKKRGSFSTASAFAHNNPTLMRLHSVRPIRSAPPPRVRVGSSQEGSNLNYGV